MSESEVILSPEAEIEKLHRLLIETSLMRDEPGVRKTQDDLVDELCAAHRLLGEVATKEG